MTPSEQLLFDIEANGYNELVLEKNGGVVKEATAVHCLVVMDLATKIRTVYKGDSLLEGVKRLWAAACIHGHNIIQYDIPILERVTKLKRPLAQPANDTLIRSRLIWPEIWESPMKGHDLAKWGAWLGIKKGEFKGPWDVWSQEMEDYCGQDVVVNDAILTKLATIKQNELVVKIEHEVCKIIARQTANGWTFDKAAAEKLIAQLEIEKAGLADQLATAFPPRVIQMKRVSHYIDPETQTIYPTKGAAPAKVAKRLVAGPVTTKSIPFNPDSGEQIAEQLIEKYQWAPEEFTNEGKPKTDYDNLVKLPYPEVKLLLKYSDNGKVLEQVIDRFKRALLTRDGKIHGSINVQGCVTGRMSHKQPNDGQVKKCEHSKPTVPGYVPGPDGHCDCPGVKMRRLYGPRAGWKLVGIDASGLELRMLANRMGRYDGGAYGKVLLTGDIHTENQKAAGLPSRDNAKTFIYGFLYGAGDAKIGKIIGKGSKEGKLLRYRFLSKLPALKKVIDSVKLAAKDKGVVTLLDTRRAPCRSQHSALNTLLQGDGAIVMKVALLVLDKGLQAAGFVPGQDYEFCGNIHDEWQIECRPEIAQKVGEMGKAAITEAGKRLKCVIQLDGEYKIGNNWSETH